MLQAVIALSCTSRYTTLAIATPQHRLCSQKMQQFASHTILQDSQQLMNQASIRPQDLSAILIDVGPSSFTSIRIVSCMAMGLAIAYETPMIPLSHLDLLSSTHHVAGDFIIALDAKMKECLLGKIYLAR